MMKGELKIQKGRERNDRCTFVHYISPQLFLFHVYFKVEQERRTNKKFTYPLLCGAARLSYLFLYFHHGVFIYKKTQEKLRL